MAWQSVNFKVELVAVTAHALRQCDQYEAEQMRLDQEYIARYGQARAAEVADAAQVVSHIRLVLPSDVATKVLALRDEHGGRISVNFDNYNDDNEPDKRMAGVWLALAHASPDTYESLFDLADSALGGDPDDVIHRVRMDGAHDPDASSPTVEIIMYW